jgi:hypothetical protein
MYAQSFVKLGHKNGVEPGGQCYFYWVLESDGRVRGVGESLVDEEETQKARPMDKKVLQALQGPQVTEPERVVKTKWKRWMANDHIGPNKREQSRIDNEATVGGLSIAQRLKIRKAHVNAAGTSA